MRLICTVAVLTVVCGLAQAQSPNDFTGVWNLNTARSEIRDLPAPPDAVLRIEQTAATLRVSGAGDSDYSLDHESKSRSGDVTRRTQTKWEGSALLINTLVGGPQNYTIMDRWTRSRDGGTLTIRRTVVRLSGESESTLVYERTNTPGLRAARVTEPPAPARYRVETGTRILLSLISSINTKATVPGDRVYLETSAPVTVAGHLVIPKGSYVAGTVLEAERAGRVKGRASLALRFDSITLPNGVTRDLRSRPGSAEGQGNLDKAEGRMKGDSDKTGDARKVGEATAAGAGVGTIAGGAAGHYGMGAGIGAAAGATAGLVGVLASRGPDLVMPKGTTMEMVLDRDLLYSQDDLRPPGRQ